MTAPLIIIGAGLAGWTTAREFRKLDTTTPILVITHDSGDFYAKPTLSNAFAQKRSPDQLVTTPAAKMVETLNVTLMAHTEVMALDTSARCVTVAAQGTPQTLTQTLTYSQLVLATGAMPIRVPLNGAAAQRVQSINSLDDFRSFHATLGTADTVIILGAGLIGCEFANDLVQGGYRVHVVDPSDRPLAALLPAAAGLQLQAALTGLGVQFHWETTAQAVDTHNDVLRVTLANGQTLEGSAVVSAIGLRANAAVANAAGIVCERGIVVDAGLKTSADGVFALGDCAQYASAGQRTLPYVMPIMNAARALAATLAGTPTALVFPLMPVSIKTPALPIVVAPPSPSQAGAWVMEASPDVSTDAVSGAAWRFLDDAQNQYGFVLTGKQTARRMELSKTTLL